MHIDALLVALIHQLLHDVALERSSLHDVEVGIAAVEHRETVVMTGREADVFRSGSLKSRYPLGSIEVGGIEASGQFSILLPVEVPVVHHPFAISHHAVDAIMEKDTELVILKCLTCL